MATHIEMYADESYGGNDSSGPLCLAMYLYERDQGAEATKEWVGVLNDTDLPKPLPFFRTSDCVHGKGVFEGMKDHCDRIQRKMIPIPRARSIIGFAATVDQGDFAEIVPPSLGYPNPYTFLAQQCIAHIQMWIKENDFTGSVIYNFEAGHKHSSDTNRIMEEVRDGMAPMRAKSYAGHGFYDKREMPLLQSADLLAWHSFTDFKRQMLGLGMRKDYQALGRPQDKIQRWTSDHLRTAVPLIEAHAQYDEAIAILEKNLRQRLRNKIQSNDT